MADEAGIGRGETEGPRILSPIELINPKKADKLGKAVTSALPYIHRDEKKLSLKVSNNPVDGSLSLLYIMNSALIAKNLPAGVDNLPEEELSISTDRMIGHDVIEVDYTQRGNNLNYRLQIEKGDLETDPWIAIDCQTMGRSGWEPIYSDSSTRVKVMQSHDRVLDLINIIAENNPEGEILDFEQIKKEGIEEERRIDAESYEPYRKIWRKAINSQKEGSRLTDPEKRALDIRTRSLNVTRRISQLMAVGEPHARFELIERCLEELESLKLLGVTSDMHVGEPQDSFEDPVKLAEYVAGQLLRLGPKEIPTGKQIKHVIDEYVEEKQKMDVKEKMNLAFIPPEEWPEVLKNFNNNHSQVNVTSRMLASDLDIQDERFSIPKPREESV